MKNNKQEAALNGEGSTAQDEASFVGSAEKSQSGTGQKLLLTRLKDRADDEQGKAIPATWRDQLSLVRTLNEHEVPYCLDSGVLLGLMREGRLLAHEKDIDLQMWAGDEEHLLRLLPLAWEGGYTVTIWLYKGLACQYRFLREGYLPVHIMLFRASKQWAWCPAGENMGPPFPGMLTRPFYNYFVLARKHWRERLIVTEVTRWPWKARRQTGTWWIPARFFEHRVYHSLFDGYIPEEWEDYLIYRYGSWRTAAGRWNIWVNDGGLRNERPEKLVDLSRFSAWGNRPRLKEARSRFRGKR